MRRDVTGRAFSNSFWPSLGLSLAIAASLLLVFEKLATSAPPGDEVRQPLLATVKRGAGSLPLIT